MDLHPAYPSSAMLRQERRTDSLADKIIWANMRIADVLRRAMVEIANIEADLDDNGIPLYSCVEGMDWEDINTSLQDMIPRIDRAAVEQFANDHVSVRN